MARPSGSKNGCILFGSGDISSRRYGTKEVCQLDLSATTAYTCTYLSLLVRALQYMVLKAVLQKVCSSGVDYDSGVYSRVAAEIELCGYRWYVQYD